MSRSEALFTFCFGERGDDLQLTSCALRSHWEAGRWRQSDRLLFIDALWLVQYIEEENLIDWA